MEKEREVTKQEAEEYCQKLNLDYIETSARENINVKESFLKLVNLILGEKIDPKKESIVRLSGRTTVRSDQGSSQCSC